MMKSTVTAIGSDYQNSGSKSNEDSHEYINIDEALEKSPKREKEVFNALIIQTKVQRLKNSTKLAKVLIIEESSSKTNN